MDYNTLLEKLEMDNSADFQYFEDVANLMELEEIVEFEDMYRLFKEADLEKLSELFKEYFKEISECLNDEYSEEKDLLLKFNDELMESIENLIEKDDRDSQEYNKFVEQLHNFRNWYATEPVVKISLSREESEFEGSFCQGIFYIRENEFNNSKDRNTIVFNRSSY